jgi:hypothetical protein
MLKTYNYLIINTKKHEIYQLGFYLFPPTFAPSQSGPFLYRTLQIFCGLLRTFTLIDNLATKTEKKNLRFLRQRLK